MSYRFCIVPPTSLFLASLLFFGPTGFAVDDPVHLESKVKTISECIQQKNLTQAQAALDQFWTEHNTDKGFVDAVRRLKDQYWTAREYAKHFDLCDRIVKAFPDDPLSIGIEVDQATGYIKLKDMGKASGKLEEFWIRCSSDDRFVDYAARIKDQYWKEGYYSDHFALCDKIVKAFPDNPLAIAIQRDQVTGYVKLKDLTSAQKAYDMLLKRFAGQSALPEEIYLIAECYRNTGQAEKAFELYHYNASQYPDHPYGLLSKAELICDRIQEEGPATVQSDFADLLKYTGRAAELARPLYRVGMACGKSGYTQKALEVHRYNAVNCPNTEFGLLSMEEVIVHDIQQKDFAAVKADYDQMLANFARERMLCRGIYRVAGVYAVHGHVDKAIELYRYNAQQHGDRDFGRWSNVEVIRHLIQRKDFAAAQACCEAFAARYSTEPTLGKELYILGREFAKAGDRDRGFQQHLYNVGHAMESNHTRWSNVEVIFYYIDKEDYKNAQSACLGFIKRYADHPELGMELGNILNRYAANGKITRAESLCKSALLAYARNEKMVWMQSGLIQVYLDQMSETDVDTAFTKLLSNHSGNPELAAVVKALGRYCVNKYNDSGMALQLYSRFLAQYSDHPGAFELAVECISLYIEMKAVDQADTAMQNLFVIYPDIPNSAQLLLGFANHYREMKLYSKAIEMYQRVLAQNPAVDLKMEAYAGAAKALVHAEGVAIVSNLPAAASRDVNAIVKFLVTDYGDAPRLGFHVFQIGEEYYFKAAKEIESGLPQSAEDNYERAIAIWEKNINELADPLHKSLAYYYSGDAYQQIGNSEKALGCYQMMVDQGAPVKNKEVFLMLATAYRHLGKYANSLEYCQKLIAEYPGYDELARRALFMQGHTYEDMKRAGYMEELEADIETKAAYEKLLSSYPESPGIEHVKEWLSAYNSK
jgi:tetratricopeptide (TPR) repeat protein